MILVEWSCKISQDKLDDFISFAQERLKPFYQSSGCKRYELLFPLNTEKEFFSYQISEEKNRYTERLTFENLRDFEELYEKIEKDQNAQDMIRKYRKDFQVKECYFKIYNKTL
jgi:quinol monooxygenase YgiN